MKEYATNIALPTRDTFPSSAIVSLDLSLSATGLCLIDSGTAISGSLIKTDKRDLSRLDEIESVTCNWLDMAIDLHRQRLVVILEGYGFSTQFGILLGELGGIIRLALYRRNIETYTIQPTSVKKFITGQGKGEKSMVMKELYKRYSLDLNDNNLADAAALAIMGYYFIHQSGIDLLKYQMESIKTPRKIIDGPSLSERNQRTRLRQDSRQAALMQPVANIDSP